MTALSLPSYVRILTDGFSEVRKSALERSDFESGPPRQARVRSRVSVMRNAQLSFKSKEDYLAFIDWFSGPLNEGANWFNWFDPVRGVSREARIVAGDLTATPSRGLADWIIPIQLETWG